MEDTQAIFPSEIFSLIFGHLEEDNAMQDLRACALVCRSFLGFCRLHIFANVAINNPRVHQTHSITILQFVNVLLKAPHIGRYVRNFTYWVSPQDTDVPNVVNALKTLERLQILDLGFAPGPSQPSGPEGPQALDWLTSPLRVGLTYLLGRPTLRTLGLDAIDGLSIADLCQATNLKTLSTSDISISLEVAPQGSLQLSTFSLAGMGTRFQSAFLARRTDGKMALDMTNLTSIEGIFCNDNRDELTSMFHYAFGHAKALSKLKLSLLYPCPGLCDRLLPATAFETLIRLDFTLHHHPALEVTDPYLGLCAELNKAMDNNRVEEVIIRISIFPGSLRTCFERPLLEWSVLDDLLISKGWPCLKRVAIHFSAHYSRIRYFDSQAPEIKAQYTTIQREYEDMLKTIVNDTTKVSFRQLSLSDTVTLDITTSVSP